jgi:hypothetical protein
MAKESNPSVADILRSNNLGTTAENIDKVFQASPVGALSTAIGDSFYGLNHRQQPGAISINKDYYGLTFFTRPRLNLSTENIRVARLLTPLLTNEPASIQRIIRCLLDHDLAKKGITSPFVDEQQAFIPILTNHLLSMNGFQDVVAPTMTAPEGMYKESWSMVDGLTQNYSTYDITANFRNIPGDPITLMFYTWITYASLVYQGVLVPYPDMIINNEIDYNTRIYRLVLDPTKTKVQKIGATGASFPVNAPLGASFNFEADRPLNSSNDQISITFQSSGAIYQDDILIDEFNRTTQIFNDGLKDGKRERAYTKVPMDALSIFNNRGYPRINPNTYDLEWWVSNEEYRRRLPQVDQQSSARWNATTPSGEQVTMNYNRPNIKF